MGMRRLSRRIAFFCLLSFSGRALLAQGVFATLAGLVSDPTGAVVPDAKITLTDAGSGSARDTVTDAGGYYSFASVPVGTYNLSVAADGFKDYAASSISLGGGEQTQRQHRDDRGHGGPDRLRQCGEHRAGHH